MLRVKAVKPHETVEVPRAPMREMDRPNQTVVKMIRRAAPAEVGQQQLQLTTTAKIQATKKAQTTSQPSQSLAS
jgi:hypothetical protein